MAFQSEQGLAYGVLRRGQRDTEIIHLGDKKQFQKPNGIYVDAEESHLTGIISYMDCKLHSYRLRGGVLQKDNNFVPTPDSQVNDASGKVLTVNFTNGMSASLYVPMILTGKVDDVVTKVGAWPWKGADATALVVSSIDYKTSKAFAEAEA